MTAQRTADAGTRLWWGIRHYWWVLAASIAVVTALALVAPVNAPLSEQREYRVDALVVAQELTIRADQLPRLAQAVFSAGSVAERAFAGSEAFGDRPARDLIPRHVRLEPLTDTIAMRVVGIDADPQVAADLANRMAAAFVDELNALGPGVGVFALQNTAGPDNATLTSREDSSLVSGVLGLLGGMAFGLGLVIVFTTVRRPVLLAEEAAALAGAPVLATLSLPPRVWSSLPAPEAVGGLAALVRQLFPESAGAAALVATGRRPGSAGTVAALICRVLGGRPRVVAPGAGRARLQDLVPSADVVERGPKDAPGGVESPVLVLVSARQFDVPQVLPSGSRAAVVVPRGCPASAVRAAAAQFVPGDLTGVVLVSHGGWHRPGGAAARGLARPEPLALEPPRQAMQAHPVQQDQGPRHDDASAASVEPSAWVVLTKRGDNGGGGVAGARVLLERSLGGGVSEPVAELITGDDGTTVPTPVGPGTYRVHELDPPNGHRPAGPWTFTTERDDIGFDLIVELGTEG